MSEPTPEAVSAVQMLHGVKHDGFDAWANTIDKAFAPLRAKAAELEAEVERLRGPRPRNVCLGVPRHEEPLRERAEAAETQVRELKKDTARLDYLLSLAHSKASYEPGDMTEGYFILFEWDDCEGREAIDDAMSEEFSEYE